MGVAIGTASSTLTSARRRLARQPRTKPTKRTYAHGLNSRPALGHARPARRVPLAEPEPVHLAAHGPAGTGPGAPMRQRPRRATACGALAGVRHRDARWSRHAERPAVLVAPTFVLGDIDAVVLSNDLRRETARAGRFPTSVADQWSRRSRACRKRERRRRHVRRRCHRQATACSRYTASARSDHPAPRAVLVPRRSTRSHIVCGRAARREPTKSQSTPISSTRNDARSATDTLDLGTAPPGARTRRRADGRGTFDLPGVDSQRRSARRDVGGQPARGLQFDRIDVERSTPGAEPRQRSATRCGRGRQRLARLPPSAIGLPDQRLAEIEIQHAYWALLSPDADERSASGDGRRTSRRRTNYAKYTDLATARGAPRRERQVPLTRPRPPIYRIYYGG